LRFQSLKISVCYGPWSAVLKAVLAGIVVGLPWPIGGTLVGGWVLLSSGLGDARKEIMGK